jgi:hypothetical protein
MSEFSAAGSSRTPGWLAGRGIGPKLRWHFGTDGPLSCLALSREEGSLFVADQSGTLTRLDRRGQIAALTRLPPPIFAIAWSDDGSSGAIVTGEETILRMDHDLHVLHQWKLPDVCVGIAISPYGNHLAVALANGMTLIYNQRKRRIAQFETMRPLSFLEFCTAEPLIFGAAEHGLVCCHNLAGAEIWEQKNWSNVGQLATTGDGDLVYLASFTHGVQTLDGDGVSIGSYVVEGTVKCVDTSFEPDRLIASTIERALYWLDADGELLWGTRVSDDVVDVICDPLGEWAICGLAGQGVYRLDWGGSGGDDMARASSK